MFEHRITDDTFIPFKDASDVMNRNTNDGLFSSLSDMKSMRHNEGYFHFKLCYYGLTIDDGEPCNEWKQSSDPTQESDITGFEAVKLSYDKGSMGEFKGLGLNIADHQDNAFIDDAPNVVQFWNSIGNFKPRVLQGINFMTGPCYTDERGRIKYINVQQKTLLAKWPSGFSYPNVSIFTK